MEHSVLLYALLFIYAYNTIISLAGLVFEEQDFFLYGTLMNIIMFVFLCIYLAVTIT